MNITTIAGLLMVGLLAGVMSSMIGIGGGIIVVPALVFLFAMNQLTAQGTSLAMLLPPIGILGVMNYYKSGNVDFKTAGILCLAFVGGSYLGSLVVLSIPVGLVKKIFAIFMLLMAVKYLFFDK